MKLSKIETSTRANCPDVWISDKRKVKDKDIRAFLGGVRIVVFDIDRTLANITRSYENSIRGATAYTLQSMGVGNVEQQRLATENDLYPLWQRPELADVWYLTYATSAYYQAQLLGKNPASLARITGLSSLPDGNLREAGQTLTSAEIDYNFSEFVPLMLTAEGTDKTTVIKNAVLMLCEKKGWDADAVQAALDKIWNQDFLKTVFQQIFMDEDGYRTEYGEPFIPCQADWNNDDTIIPEDELRALLLRFKNKGIATARPRSELLRFLDRFKLTNLFNPNAIAANEDGSKTERIKKSLATLSGEGDPKEISAVYIGDTVGDINAVRELQKEGYNIGVVSVGSKAPDNLMQANCEALISQTDAYINSLSNLPEILAGEEVKT